MTIQQFKDNGYVHLKNALDKQFCEVLTNELKALVESKNTVKDDQCPLSEAIHGAKVFDNLLEDMLPYFEQQSGLKLYPTYSYARLYSQGEELKNHRDREACEISVSITLGFEGNVWPIYMADEATKEDGIFKTGEYNLEDYIKNISEIKMDIGDAVMYRGMTKFHWREPYKEGKWQAQVFLHYVDQNGTHAEWKYDKRESLGSISSIEDKIRSFDDCYKVDNAISEGFCKKLIEEYAKPEVKKELPYIGSGSLVNLDVRNAQRLQLPLYAGIGATLTSIGLQVNYEIWKYNITNSNQAEFLMYDINGKYETHVDTFHSISDQTRKLTVLAFLNNDFEGGQFYIQNNQKRLYPQQTPGTVLVFPSFMPHGVEPVTKGIRYSVVTWMVGPYFK